MKFSQVSALVLSKLSSVTTILAGLGLVVTVFLGQAAYAQTEPDGVDMTPQEEFFCGSNFDGKLNGLCNAFCTAMNCDSLDASASVNACLKMQTKIDPLLEEHNAANGTNFQIIMADVLGGSDGACNKGPLDQCDLSKTWECLRQRKVCENGQCVPAPEM